VTGSVLVAGTGLIGTSLGLALQGHTKVFLADADPTRLEEAVARGAGLAWDGQTPVDLAVVAVPPGATAGALIDLQHRQVALTFTHVAGTQSRVQADLEALNSDVGTDLSVICGGHPLAGREVTGPAGATADLFLGRPWVACPSGKTSADALRAVTRLAEACGAEPVVMSAEEHDRAVALSSHLPQAAASALAARLVAADAATVAVSGPGLHDTTRVAASDAGLWTDVMSGNAAQLAPLVGLLAEDLQRLAAALRTLAAQPGDAAATSVVRDLLGRGNAGRALVPVKRGVRDRDVGVVTVRLSDEPGRLADLLVRSAAAGVNVEDVRVEHLPGRPTGLVELLVRAVDAGRLGEALRAGGQDVVSP
jgi:prephenate dehydrogenase